ncbi:MAG TPA: hypothetical protein VHQ94_17650 [Pyrinomonadaceae bacterium]|nr:hypothetical protein [Pyrinomonadaceae bacterium]
MDALRTRLRISHLLQGGDYSPPGFPPHAILIVRHLAVARPIPLSFRLDSNCESEIRDALTRLYRKAVRPVAGRIPASADAVLFTDVAEWLACLGVAIVDRHVEAAWYWRTCLRGHAVSSPSTLVAACVSEPRFVPAAFVRLVQCERLGDVLKLFSPREANTIFHALAGEWQLPQLDLPARPAFGPAEYPQRSASSQLPRTHGQATAEIARNHNEGVVESGMNPLWQAWVSLSEKLCAALPVETQRLLASAAALFHAPAMARSANFAREVNQWLATNARHATRTEASRSTASLPVAPVRVLPQAGRRVDATPVSDNAAAPDDRSLPLSSAREQGAEQVEAPHSFATPETSSAVRNDEAPRESEIAPLPFWADLPGCETKIGGVLFLLNLLQRMRLPECFDEQLDLSAHVSGWGLLELLGKALLGPTSKTFGDDPLWQTLQRLDGRSEREAPGASLPDVAEFRLPERWLKFIDRESLVDQSRTAFTNRMQEMIGWSDLSPSMQRWMCWAFPFLHHVLLRALGEEVATPEDLETVLLQKAGTLYCTATHVDLVMRMDQIALPVRQAGLDANPGWLPDLMRVVSFHFE